jgi:hypothetical protein
MTPEEVTKLYAQKTRYNTQFDADPDQYCPPLVLRKDGKVAKRQPQVREMGVNYWKAQCSFRGLKTSGRIDELKDLVRNRDRGKDIAIKQEQDRIQALLDAYHEQKRKEDEERWWQEPSIKIELKIESDAQRALSELLDRDPGIRDSTLLVQTRSNALTYWAQQLGLACQTVQPPRSMLDAAASWLGWGSWTMIGRADLVQHEVNEMSAQAIIEIERESARVEAAREAQTAQQRNRHAAMMDEARSQADWDLTGSWSVQCTELATYSDPEPIKLTMEIYHDDYRLDDVRGSDDQSHDDSDSEEDFEEQRRPIAPVTVKATAHIPRYCAVFHFGPVEGMMRIYPPESSRSNTAAFKVSNSPHFEYIWRGRETGEGEIQTTADERAFPITFGDSGTSFEATFYCEYIPPVSVTGRKISHGRGRKMNSKEQWSEMSERGYDRESSRRWGGGW